LVQFSQFLRLSRAFCASSRDPKYSTLQRLPLESVSHSWAIWQVPCRDFREGWRERRRSSRR
jgi:hypothetical protein